MKVYIIFFSTLNTYILQSMWSNFMKFLSHDLIQVKYKILWFDFEKIYLFIYFWQMQQTWQFRVVLGKKLALGL